MNLSKLVSNVKLIVKLFGIYVSIKMLSLILKLFNLQKRISTFEKSTNVVYLRGVGLNPLGLIKLFLPKRDQIYDFKTNLFENHSKLFNKKIDIIFTAPHLFYSKDVVFSRSPEITKYITKDKFNNWVKSSTLQIDFEPLLGQGIFAVNHGFACQELKELNISDLWTFQRKTASKIFTKNIFKNHVFLTLEKNTQKVIENIEKTLKKQKVKSMKKEFYNFTLDSIGDIGFGVELNTLQSKKYEKFSQAFDQVVPNISKRDLLPFWKYPIIRNFIKSEQIVKKSIKELNKCSYEIIEERIKLIENKETRKELNKKGDILSLFVNSLVSKDIDLKSSKAKQFLRDVIMSFKIAGRDTTACTLCFLFHLISLSENKKVQEKLFQEVDKIKILSYENILNEKLKYLDGVVNETLRLFPPVPVDAKENVKEDILPNGIKVKPGTKITFEIFAMGRDKSRYPDPMKVKPERWFDLNLPDEEFPVFQGGQRVCLGQDLAKLEIKFLVINLIKKYKFAYTEKEEEKIKKKKVMYVPGLTIGFNSELSVEITPRN
eukprot:snap_masked-scaffold_30-processed-gene-3.108-mRNA-1 protein AED:0.43 eAED:0.45 QI:0/0/0/0.5/1/1/2/0/545